MPTDPAPEKVAALARAESRVDLGLDGPLNHADFEEARKLLAALTAAGWSLTRTDEVERPLDVTRLARALEASARAVAKSESVGWRYRELHDDVLCARDAHGCGCLCHVADAVAAEYAALAPRDEEAGT